MGKFKLSYKNEKIISRGMNLLTLYLTILSSNANRFPGVIHDLVLI